VNFDGAECHQFIRTDKDKVLIFLKLFGGSFDTKHKIVWQVYSSGDILKTRAASYEGELRRRQSNRQNKKPGTEISNL
jgi:hypothetical protein